MTRSIGLVLTAGLLAGACATAPEAGLRPAVEREVSAPGIPGVVAAGETWRLAWTGTGTADGAVAAGDGGLLFAQEQTDRVFHLAADDSASIYLADTEGAGSLSFNTDGELLVAQRTCTDPGLPDEESCATPTKIAVLAPEPRVLASAFADGRGLGRLNDLAADSRGGAYFTVGGAYYARPDGTVHTVVERDDVGTNGIVLSPDEQTLFVTNGDEVLAFDIGADGATSNERVFAQLEPGDAGDGMTVDAQGRLYVTSVRGDWGVYVFSPDGERLGFIPTPRPAVSTAFAGPDKRVLYVTSMGAIDADGQEHDVPEGARNTAMTVYRLPMLAQGYLGRAK